MQRVQAGLTKTDLCDGCNFFLFVGVGIEVLVKSNGFSNSCDTFFLVELDNFKAQLG